MSLKKELLGRKKDEKIECPRCWVEMCKKEVEVSGPNVTIDICPRCDGIWLDPGELGKLLGDRKLTDYLTKEIGTKSKSRLLCPRCRALMDIEKADDVEVDVCLGCHGVWLDSGELDALEARSAAGFEGDELAKAEERWEESVYKDRNSPLNRLIRKILR